VFINLYGNTMIVRGMLLRYPVPSMVLQKYVIKTGMRDHGLFDGIVIRDEKTEQTSLNNIAWWKPTRSKYYCKEGRQTAQPLLKMTHNFWLKSGKAIKYDWV